MATARLRAGTPRCFSASGNSGGDESDGSEARQRCVQTFEKPISQLRSPLQPQVLTRPARHTLCDNRVHRSWLRAKLSAMRFDIEGLSTERSSDTRDGTAGR